MSWRFWKKSTLPGPPAAPVAMAVDGFYYRDGHRLCEDCWQPIPRYVDFPDGLTSPESDGTAEMNYSNAKQRRTLVEGKPGLEALRKAVCLQCYQVAFRRHYPKARLSPMRADVIPPTVQYVPTPEPEMAAHVPEPRLG